MNISLIRQYYESEEYVAKLRARAETMRRCAEDPDFCEGMKAIWAEDCERFVEDVLFLIIPEFGDAIKPFFLFPYQKRILRRLIEAEESGKDHEILIDKPRGMGLSWIIDAYIYWRWLFRVNWSAIVLSRTENEVDDGTSSPGKSLFGKIRWMQARTPKWLMPVGFQAKGKKGTYTDSSLRINNPVLGSSIHGSSTNSNAGRSNRSSFVFVDECFAIDRFTEVHRSLSSVARVQVYVSTTKASMEAKGFKDTIEKAGDYIPLEWRDHPWKDEEWYQEQLKRAEFDPEIMKEVDKGYSVSEKQQYYPQIKDARVAPVKYDPALPLYTGLDFGKGDLTVIVWVQFDGDRINVLECYASKGKGKVEWYAPFLNFESPVSPEFQYSPAALLLMEKVRGWGKVTAHFGEVAHTIRSMADNQSISSVLARSGIRITVNTYGMEHEPRRRATSTLLAKTVFNENSSGVLKLYDAIANSRYGTSNTSEKSAMTPRHDDEIADYRSAFENLCVNVGRIFKYQREDLSDKLKSNSFVRGLIDYLKV